MFSNGLAYRPQPYPEVMSMRPAMMYISCATSLREKNGEIITFAKFEEVNIWTKTRNDAESGDESDDDSIISLLLSEEEIYAMDSGDESDDELVSTDMLEDICDNSQSRPRGNRREANYKIFDSIKQIQPEWKGA